MNCFSVAGLLDLHREGRLSPARSERVKAHLAACPACSALYAPVAARAAAPAPASFKDRLKKAVQAAPAQAPEPRRASVSALPLTVLLSFGLALALLHAALGGLPGSVRDSAAPDFSVRRLP